MTVKDSYDFNGIQIKPVTNARGTEVNIITKPKKR